METKITTKADVLRALADGKVVVSTNGERHWLGKYGIVSQRAGYESRETWAVHPADTYRVEVLQ